MKEDQCCSSERRDKVEKKPEKLKKNGREAAVKGEIKRRQRRGMEK